MRSSEIDTALASDWCARSIAAILIRLTNVTGSAPRESGAAMVVSVDQMTGTIGGGAAEWAVVAAARKMLVAGSRAQTIDLPLGPEIGQCCGGRISARLEVLDQEHLSALMAPPHLPKIFVFGAGHIGQALANSLSHLPVSVVVIDERKTALDAIDNVAEKHCTPLPEAIVNTAPAGSAFVVCTHDHATDFLIVEAALSRRDAAYVGMIGSASKRAVLAKRLQSAGISDIGLTCPIGGGISPDKRPAIIAAATTAELVAALFPNI